MEIQQIKSFFKYFPSLGVPMPDENALRDRLKQSIENSRKKGYHGNDGGVNEVPKLQVQSSDFVNENGNPFTFFDEEKKAFLPKTDLKWQKACLEKFQWVGQLHKNSPSGQEMAPHEYALLSDNDALEIKTPEFVKDNYDRLRVEVNNRNESTFINKVHNTTLVEDYSPVEF